MIKLKKNSNPDDHSYWQGRGYFTDEEEFGKYMQKVGTIPTEVSDAVRCNRMMTDPRSQKSSCNKFAAVDDQHKSKFHGIDVSGVCMVLCARHGLVAPHGAVDLQRGER